MEYHINLGAWKSVFAVPSELVDKHLKLAGAAQLKVILWVLRNADKGFTVEEIANALNMQAADVRDCMQYWTETGMIAVLDGAIQPPPLLTESREEAVPASPPPVQQEPKPKAVLSRPEKPDMKYIAQRMSEDQNIAFLMQSADEIFGRITSPNDRATLMLIYEHYGLPIEVIIMLMQYAAEIGKCHMRYIEKVAIEWSDREINTLELADQQIKYLTSGRNAARIVQRTIGQEEHSPTEQEIAFAEMWVNQWRFTTDMIRKAYETCVDAKGKYIAKYTNSILERWHRSGIATPEQVKAEKQAKKPKKKDSYQATYDIAAYESTSVIYEE